MQTTGDGQRGARQKDAGRCGTASLGRRQLTPMRRRLAPISQFMHAPTEGHMDATKRILRYLKATLGDGLVYTKCPDVSLGHSIYTYTDADWAGDPDDRRSVSGFYLFLDSNLICWSSKKQRAVARSSIEAEYRAMAAGTAESSWLRHLLGELTLPIVQSSLLCDNQSAIKIAFNQVLHNRTKHIEIDQHFIRQKVEEGEILPMYRPTSEQIADLFTKGLTGQHFWELKNKLCMPERHELLKILTTPSKIEENKALVACKLENYTKPHGPMHFNNNCNKQQNKGKDKALASMFYNKGYGKFALHPENTRISTSSRANISELWIG
ncbi:Copia protein [Nymphaea thermarum]|nr:Copia protein [Nymphaea thermarum]